MNEDSPTPFDTIGDEPVEARIVAWVLGEASAFEAAELERLCEERPELLVFRRRMRALHGLLTEAEATEPDESWKLPPEKRKVLDEIFGEEKITRLDPQKETRIRHSGRRAFLAIAACVLITLFVTQLTPRKHQAEATIEVKPPVSGQFSFGNENSGASTPPALTPQFFGTEFEKIKSSNSLGKVVDNLELTKRWNVDKESAIQKLKDSIETENIRGTDLISIRVRNEDQREAQEIVHELVDSYKEYRHGIEERDAERGLYELKRAVRDQEDKVEEKRKVLATIVRNKGIIYKGQDSFYGQSGVDEDQGARSALETYSKLQQEKMQTESQINSLLKYDGEQLMATASGLDLPDNVVRQAYPQYLEAKRALDAKKIQGMGDRHPEVLAQAEQMKALKKQIDEGVVQLRSELTAKLDMASNSLKAVEAMKDDTREDAIKRGLDAQDYVDAKREFERDQELLQKMKLQQMEKMIREKMTEESVVVHEEPPRAESKKSKPASAPATAPSAKSETTYNLAARTSDRQAGAKEVARQSQIARQPKRNVELRASAAPAPAAELAAPVTMPELPAMAGAAGEGKAFGGGGGALGMAADSFEMQPTTLAPAEPAAGPPAPSLQPLARNSQSTTRSMAAGGNPSSRSSKDLSDSSDKPADAPMAATGTADASGFADGALVNGLNDSLDAGKSEAGKPSILFGRDSASPRQQATQAPAAEGKIASSKSDVYPEKAETASRLRKAGTSENAPAVFAGDDVSKLSESDKATRAELRSRVDAAWELSVPKDQEAELVLKDKYWDTSFVEKPREKDRSGSTEYELHTGFSSEYLFRGMDLNPKDGSKPAAADLAELMEEIPAAENPYSTFSLNISDASFQLAKAALAKGERPDPASIKPEQFYNAVDYGDPAPMSNEPVAATIEQSAHPVIPGRNLVRVALRTGSTGRSAVQPLRLTLLVDQSGSMVREDRRASMNHALAQLGILLTKSDRVTVIGFSRTPHLLAEALTGDEAGNLSELVNQTASEGGTNLEEALRLGAEKAASHQLAGAQNRVVLFTDGAANLGDADPARLAEQVKSLRQKGIAFDVAGIGADGLNDRLLSEMARNGNGRYYVVGDEKNDSFARQLAGAFRPAADNVKVQVNFNPRRVGKYKLLGFEKDRLKTEDFRNDAVDAAELAAEEAGVAIYQVEPLAGGTGELGEVSVRFRDAAGGEMVERSWTILYDAQASAFDRATPSMQLAGLSLLAAEKLRGGPLGDAIDFKQHAGSAALVKQFYGSSPRVADMLQVIEKLK